MTKDEEREFARVVPVWLHVPEHERSEFLKQLRQAKDEYLLDRREHERVCELECRRSKARSSHTPI